MLERCCMELKIKELEDRTIELLEHYFKRLQRVGNGYYYVSADFIPYDKFESIKKKRDRKQSIRKAEDLVSNFSDEHTAHMELFWEFVEELEIQEIEAKKVIEESFIKFQNEAWRTIKMLKNRADEKLEEFEAFDIRDEYILQEKLVLLKSLTFDALRDSWFEGKNPIEV